MAGPMVRGGLGRRAGFGAKLCLKRMNSLGDEEQGTSIGSSSSSSSAEKKNAITNSATFSSKKGKDVAVMKSKDNDGSSGGYAPSNTKPPKFAKDIDALITQELLVAYARGRLGYPFQWYGMTVLTDFCMSLTHSLTHRLDGPW